jgi:NAD(P)-dependent dehydrogenase (short-subunit alcohol dehydrogenase family)
VRDRLAPIYGGVLEYRQIDVRNTENVENVIARIAESHSRLDGLVAAAGIQKVIPALDFQSSDIDEILSVNYKGVYVSAVACARQMIKYKIPGSLLLVASMSGLIANKGFKSSVYNSSKAAVVQLARSLAMEWGPVFLASSGPRTCKRTPLWAAVDLDQLSYLLCHSDVFLLRRPAHPPLVGAANRDAEKNGRAVISADLRHIRE